jgi:hypothetical protein
MDTRLSDEEMALLRWLAPAGNVPVPRSRMPLADRAADRLRQKCKRDGLIEFVGGIIDGKHRAMGWRLTRSGRAALTPSPPSIEALEPRT